MNAKDPAVSTLLKALKHPLKREIAAARLTILGAAAQVSEGVKWNAPSFAAKGDYFATFHLRETKHVQVIFHTGAKAKGKVMQGKVDDPERMLRWLAKDRAIATSPNAEALAALTRAWIAAL
jgi:hypothetical protein